MSAAVIIIKRQRQCISAYRNAGALGPETARRPDELGVRTGFPFTRLVSAGVMVESGDGTYYIDPIAAERYWKRRRAKFWAIMGVLAIIGLVIVLVNVIG